ncbi:4-(cytidine 5'-diphospho)-2-C-methyl-D-erythritol kinase [Agromyces seonyuensis]|uniref:4-diphosphocytidyl-2-C-methyl-D-erythritol kinase n=1 Tax=Agromyces seonyuensis TaxID=2662446 RepID=A0A6I4NXG8_9MICO|nr:4-(cytidine 5'-diphospho)-2-C-methyl-D-erythritol kinase [Agromyces seonyuensis]MWB99006.1 4-(cytidine 5'-diphospho)-2-C-methyl-D-erythritol kinase [Agromyces seonyuensis]
MTIAETSEAVHSTAPGKINLYMRVGALQSDGYHDVATAYQAVSLAEHCVATPSTGFTVSFGGSIDTTGLPVDDSNLAIRAARLLAAHTGVADGVHLSIDKHVPIAGGMGGGSADAAAALVACDALWGTELSREELHGLAAQLGADVPFALMGGTAVGTGRGERLSPALATGVFHWVLVPAEFGLSTPAVYRELDRLRDVGEAIPAPETPEVDTAVLHALRAGDAVRLADALHNDLQAAALSLAPPLRDILDLGLDHGALAGIVSGSGPTLAFLAVDAAASATLAAALRTAGHPALEAHAPAPGARPR